MLRSINHFCNTVLHLFSIVMAVLVLTSCRVAEPAPTSVWPYENETKEQKDARMAWWRDARFGMFIHWGVYSVPAGTYEDQRIKGIGEWIMNRGKIPVAEYKAYAGQFNPVKYDPDAWVRLAKEAGMKYIVITSKHHDGFALFDSKVTGWDMVNATPYGKDLLDPLAKACRKHGIKLGLYYSQAQDWCHPGGAAMRRLTRDGYQNHPDAKTIDAYTAAHNGNWDPAQEGDMDEYIRTIAVPQVREILSNYGDIAVLWWDTPTGMNAERAAMFEPVISQFPGLITNDRLGGDCAGDTETPEQHIPATGFGDRDWETCMTMNDTWGYKSYDDNWKSTETLLRNLIDIASKGGNYLLNVGPTSQGEIPQPSIERLKEIGQWMKVNSESIYGTAASPFSKLLWGRCTKKETNQDTTLYFHVFEWPADGKLIVPGLKTPIKNARLLASGQKLNSQMTDEGVVLTLPMTSPDPIAAVIAATIDGTVVIEKIMPEQSADGTVALPAALADIHNRLGAYTKLETKDGIKNIGFWENEQCWIEWEFSIDRPGRFEIVAEIAAAENSAAELQIGDEKLDVKFPVTGGFDSFQPKKLGTIEIKQAGAHALQIRPSRGNWQPVNVRGIQLSPVQ